MTIRWSPRAITHLVALRAHIARDRPQAATQVAATVLAAVDRLADMPSMGRPGRVPGTREWVVPATPYLIAYRVGSERLDILGVFHGRRKWPDRF